MWDVHVKRHWVGCLWLLLTSNTGGKKTIRKSQTQVWDFKLKEGQLLLLPVLVTLSKYVGHYHFILFCLAKHLDIDIRVSAVSAKSFENMCTLSSCGLQSIYKIAHVRSAQTSNGMEKISQWYLINHGEIGMDICLEGNILAIDNVWMDWKTSIQPCILCIEQVTSNDWLIG